MSSSDNTAIHYPCIHVIACLDEGCRNGDQHHPVNPILGVWEGLTFNCVNKDL